MFYEAELRLLRETFRKCRIQTNIVDWSIPVDERQDLGTYLHLTQNIAPDTPVKNILPLSGPTTIHRLTDIFACRHLYLALPELSPDAVLVIGPYLSRPLTQQYCLERAEQLGLQPSQQAQLDQFYSNLPTISENSHLFALLDTFCEHIWGIGNYAFEDVNQDVLASQWLLPQEKTPADGQSTLLNIKHMEQRYMFENELMEAVSLGQSHKADMLLGNFSSFSFEQRLADPVRNLKNYTIIMNTLLRKAAEKGGVHPVYLDSVSSTFAAKIEQLDTADAVLPLMTEMFRSYCRIVRKHSMKDYSPLTQKAITFIDTDLSADLSLRTISQALNISSSYLSTSFKKETGQTITDYINRRRVSHAKHLLKTTSLQIQTIAQHCGILDVHYFSKVFKRITGITPKQYRQSVNEH